MAAPAGRRAIVVDPLTAAPVSAIVAATGFDVAAETAVVADALVLAELHRPDVVLVAQDAVGFESDTIPRLRHASEGLVVLVTTDGAAAARAHDSGAVEVVHRMQMLDLEPALRRVARRLDEEGTGPLEQRVGPDRRRRAEWNKVTRERRQREQRGIDWGPIQGAFNRGEWIAAPGRRGGRPPA